MTDENSRRLRVGFGMGYRMILFGGTFIVFSMMFAMLNGPFDTVTTEASARSSTNASATGINWMTQAWEWMPLWAALLGVTMLVAGAVIESGRRF